MKFIIVNGTLTPSTESNVSVICEMVKMGFNKLGHECEIVNMAELNYKNSTGDEDDDLRPVIHRMIKPDVSGIIIGTPIWWGMFSSHTQALIERLDYIDSWSIDDNHYKPMMGKVFGSIVSGAVDGWQHITGTLYSFASNLSLTVPPLCNIESEAQGKDNILKDSETIGMVKSLVNNMVVWAEAMQKGETAKKGRHKGHTD